MIDQNRARGLMTGIAVGNLLGIKMEGWPQWLISENYPEGVREITASLGYPDDDDLAQAIEIADAASTRDGLDIEDLGRRFWTWAESNGLGMGNLTHSVMKLYGGSRPQKLGYKQGTGNVRSPEGIPILEASKRAWDGRQAGNGALMRCAPLAIRWHNDPNRLVKESILSAVPTHWDMRCGWSCSLMNLVCAAALRGETLTLEELLSLAQDGIEAALPAIQDYGYQAEIPDSVLNAVNHASQSKMDDVKFDGRNKGFTLLSLKSALISYWRAEDFESGVSESIEVGGDTDTNGAIVGAVLGAKFGLTSIPERWQHKMNELRSGRVSMEEYAERLLAKSA